MNEVRRGHDYKWTVQESRAVLDTVDSLRDHNPDMKKGELFEVARDIYNEQFKERTTIAFKNHYYFKKRETEMATLEEQIAVLEEEAVEIIEAPLAPMQDEEKSEIITFIDGIVNRYEKISSQNKVLHEENMQMSNENSRMKKEVVQLREDYDSLLRVIDRARKIVVDEEIPMTDEHRKFRQERNGNLVTA